MPNDAVVVDPDANGIFFGMRRRDRVRKENAVLTSKTFAHRFTVADRALITKQWRNQDPSLGTMVLECKMSRQKSLRSHGFGISYAASCWLNMDASVNRAKPIQHNSSYHGRFSFGSSKISS